MMFMSQKRSIIWYRERDSGNRSSAERKILQCDMLIFFLLLPYCFYNKKQSKCWKEPNVLSKDKSSMSRGTDGLKVEVIAMFMYRGVFLMQLTLCYRQTWCLRINLCLPTYSQCLIHASICPVYTWY